MKMTQQTRAFLAMCVITLCPTAWAQETPPPPTPTPVTTTGAPTEFKRFLIDAQYENTFQFDLRHNSLSGLAAPSVVSGQLTGMRAIGSVSFRPYAGTAITAYGGSAFLNQLSLSSISATYGEISQQTQFDNSALYGLGAKIELLPMIRFHIGPSFRFLRTDFTASRGSLTNTTSGCTYDYSSNSTSTCMSTGLSTGGGVMSARFSQNEFRARLEIGVDMIGEIGAPILGIIAGVEETITIVNGTFVYTPPSGSGSSYENYTLTSLRNEGFYVQLFGHVGPVRIFAEGRGLTATAVSGGVGVNF